MATHQREIDAYLAASARAGDARALSALVVRWHKRLTAHAARLSGEADAARDIVQEAWGEIIKSLRLLDDANAFPAFAYRIVTRRTARHIKRKVQDRALAAALQAEPVAEEIAAPETTQSDIERLRTAIRNLPAAQHAAIALFYFDEMSVAEIAVALDVPEGTVKTRLMHARQKLRQTLEGESHEQQ